MPFILLFLILLITAFGNFIPLEVKSFLFAISLTIKSLIIFLLPIVIFGLLFKVCAQLAHRATKIVFLILVGVCLSNFVASLISGYIGSLLFNLEMSISQPEISSKSLEPLFNLALPKLIANDKAMLGGLLFGVITAIYKPKIADRIALIFDKIISKILLSFTFLIPIFVAGFIVKLQYDNIITMIIENYAVIFGVIAITGIIYLSFLYFVASGFIFSKFLNSLRNMLPACIIGFSTMSSAAAMPLMIVGTEKNSSNPELAQSIIPLVVNFHLLGCCISIPIFVFTILKNYGMAEPSLVTYLIFAAYFVIAKFSVAAVPGGGIIVMLPIIESCFGFSAEMLSLITALYILFDPIITCTNILGNGCFAMIMSNLHPNKESLLLNEELECIDEN